MQIKHFDFGALVIGREILKRFPSASLEFIMAPGENFYHDFGEVWSKFSDFHFGKPEQNFRAPVGVFCDRKYCDFFEDQIIGKEKSFAYAILASLVQEGFGDSVEFRRLGRKFLRSAKHAHIRTLICPDLLMGAEKTPQVLRHLAGTQMRVVTVVDLMEFLWDTREDFFPANFFDSKKRQISIKISNQIETDITFIKKRSENILQTKIRDTDIEIF